MEAFFCVGGILLVFVLIILLPAQHCPQKKRPCYKQSWQKRLPAGVYLSG
jgi:hypothetical protein